MKDPREHTKTRMVLEYLKEHKTITSLQAIEMFGATRLSAIIYNLRHTYNYDIVPRDIKVKDRWGFTVPVAEYIFFGRE